MKTKLPLLTALLLAPLACYSEPPANNTETVPVKKSSPQNFDDEDAPDPIGASAKTGKSVSMASAHLQVANVEDPQSKQARRNAFGVDFIQLNGTIGQRISYSGETLALLDWEKTFLSPFLSRTKNVPNKTPSKIYVGLGKTLTGLVYWAAYRGDDEALALKQRILNALVATQDADGYIGAFGPEHRGRKMGWDTHEITYIMNALAADYRIFGTPSSGQAAERLAAYVTNTWQDEGVPTWGMENCFLEFGKDGQRDFRFADWILKTHFPNQKYRNFRWGQQLGYNTQWDDYDLSGKHVYHFTASAAAQLWLNQKFPNPLLVRPTEAAEKWIKDGGATLPGTFGYSEKWSKTQFGRSGVFNPDYEHCVVERAHKNGEVCSRVHVAELLDTHSQTSQPQPWHYDVIERVLYNSFFAAQSVEASSDWQGPKIRYDTATEGPRAWYWRPTFCCAGNFRRFMFTIPSMMYQNTAEGLYVNLYEESQAKIQWAGRQWEISQETKYPRNGLVRIMPRPDKPVEATIHFRIPNWVRQPSLTVNGKSQPVVPGSYASVTREWKPEDVVEINLPMEWQWIAGYREQQGRAGLLRGPLVFTLNPVLNKVNGYKDLDWNPEQFGEAVKGEPPGKYTDYEPSYQLLREIVLDPASLKDPIPDATIYPDGIAAVVKGWKHRNNVAAPHDLELKLTEFPDEGGRTVSFLLNEPSSAQPDPLFACELKEEKLFPSLWAEAKKMIDPSKLKKSEPKIPGGAILIPPLRSSYDEMTSEGDLFGRRAWMSVKDAERPYRKMGFRFPQDVRDRKKGPVKVHLVYLDRGDCEVELFYDSSDVSWNVLKKRPDVSSETRRWGQDKLVSGAFKIAGNLSVGNSGEWLTKEFLLDDARFESLSDGKDMLLYIHADQNFIVGGIYVENLPSLTAKGL
jgi:hypothetical protein